MIKTKAMGNEVYVADQQFVNVNKSDVEFLKDKVFKSDRRRSRLCAHKENENKLHEMIIAFDRDTYIRPSQHLNKEESIHILEGIADFIFFDEKGKIVKIIPLGDYSSGRQFYCRTPAFTFHTVIVQSELMVVHETTRGPFDRADTVYADWAPADEDKAAVKKYMDQLRANIAKSAGSRKS